LQSRPARQPALPECGYAALPELAALLRQGLRAARLLQARSIYRRRAGGTARTRLSDRSALLRRAGWRADLSGCTGGASLTRPRRQSGA
jgi:hypothetical protein